MNVSCPSCPAKYVVPDAKIRGRRLRMVCKRCGRAFIIDDAHGSSPPLAGLQASSDADSDWVVMVNDRDATQMSSRQLVELYALGTIHSRTLVWQFGSEDWRTPFDFPALAAALHARGFQPSAGNEPSLEVTRHDAYDDATVVGVPSLQARFAEPPRYRELADSYDDEATVAVPRAMVLARRLEEGFEPGEENWVGEDLESFSNERTVSGDVRALAAHATSLDDDDSELGVARLPPELEEPGAVGSILIAPNSGEEPAPTPPSSEHPRTPKSRPHPDPGTAAASSSWGYQRKQAVGAYSRSPIPAAGAPPTPRPSHQAPASSADPPESSQRPSHWPPLTMPRTPAATAEGRSAPAPHPPLASSESRIPPPPSVIPPPPITNNPATPRSTQDGRSPPDGAALHPKDPSPGQEVISASDPQASPSVLRQEPVCSHESGGTTSPRAQEDQTGGPSGSPSWRPPAPGFAPQQEPSWDRPRRRGRGIRMLGWLALMVLCLVTAVAGVYAYDRDLLVRIYPELPRLAPSLFPSPPTLAPPPALTASAPSAATSSDGAMRDAGTADAESLEEVPTDAGLFSRRAAAEALEEAAEAASVCFDPTKRIYGGMVIVTFANSGRVSKIDRRGPLAGSAVGDCVAQTLERVKIAPFQGDSVPVAVQVLLK
ncbi:MAG: zinc-ribbon domain-containing protein [Polyangiaceae bacterium]|nr:zinc-ribbon domain-containing protein [Polyangiaceae bacterium]